MHLLPAISKAQLGIALVAMVMAILSLFGSIMTLKLIRDLGHWNSSIILIWSMTISQLIYDLTFFFLYPMEEVYLTGIFVSTFGGISVAIWTNIMVGQVYYVVTTLQTSGLQQYYNYFILAAVVAPLIYAAVTVSMIIDDHHRVVGDIYNGIRLASITFNVVVYLLVANRFRKLGTSGGHAMNPLRILADRLKYYPVVQVISRIWPSFYEIYYGFSESAYRQQSTFQQASLYLYALLIPSAGFGYFIVFLNMQPRAYRRFKMLMCPFICCFLPGERLKQDEGHRGSSGMQAFDPENSGIITVESGGDSVRSGQMGSSLLSYDEMDEDYLGRVVDNNRRAFSEDLRENEVL